MWNTRDPKHCNRNFANKYWSEIVEVLQVGGISLKWYYRALTVL